MGDNQNVDDIQKLDPGYAVGGQKKKNGYVTEDGNEQGMQGSPLEGGERMGSGCDKPQSVLAESDQEDVVRTDAEYDQEKVHSSYENNHNRGEMDELPGSYFHKSSFEFKERTFNSDKGTEDSNHSQEFTMTVDDKRAKEIEGSSVVHGQNTSSRDNKVMNDALRKSQDESKSSYNNIEGDFIQSPNGTLSSPFRPPAADIEGEGKNGSADIDVEQANENYNYSRNSPIESRKINVPNSAPQSPESSPTHEKSPQRLSTNKDRPLDLHEGDVDSPTPSRLKISFSPERSDPVKRVSPQRGLSPSYRQTSPERPLQESNQKDGRPLKRKSASPERHYSPRKHRRQERSISRSPIRRRDSGSRYGREHRDRSRSRSPYNRDRYRLPRRRYSPRRRSPQAYHSRHPSPRRRPWSPPPNRRTGVGKPGKNLFVAGFSFLTTERDLERKFSRFGRVRDVRIVRDKRSGDSRGFGFLSLEKDEDADAAIRALDETEWNGRVILVEKSKSTR